MPRALKYSIDDHFQPSVIKMIITCLAHDLFRHGDECSLSTDTPEGRRHHLYTGDVLLRHIQLNSIKKLLYSILHHIILRLQLFFFLKLGRHVSVSGSTSVTLILM